MQALIFPGGAGQGQSPPVFCPGATQRELQSILQMDSTCAGLGGSQVEPKCDPKLAAASARPGAT